MQMEKLEVTFRQMGENDIPEIVQAFQELGWNKPAHQYEGYLVEQFLGDRIVIVAFVGGEFAGYLTICVGFPDYAPFVEKNIPEISDFNVLPKFRRRGIGTQLMDLAEAEVAKISPIAGIGVGLTTDYGSAQRMYARRGYIPDGRGLYKKGHHLKYGENVIVDDDLVLYMTKDISDLQP